VPSLLSSIAHPVEGFFEWFGSLSIFSWQVLKAAVTPPYEWRELVRQLDEVGSKSLPLVALAGAAIGVVLSMEARYSLSRFGAKSMFPVTLVYSVIQVMGPIITGLIVSGRVGAGIGAELASMKVTEQIDAIEASAINPYRLLAATRILACILMLPLLDSCRRRIRLVDRLVCTDSCRTAFVPSVHRKRISWRHLQRIRAAHIQDRGLWLIIGLVLPAFRECARAEAPRAWAAQPQTRLSSHRSS
jgi:ABC transport permease subunit